MWAKGKPASPGKPVETWDLTIWIGEDGEDLVLTDPEYLFAEDVPCSGGLWDLPKKKGEKPNPSNFLAASVDLMAYYGDNCGTYQLADLMGYNSAGEEAWLVGDFHLETYEVAYVRIEHLVSPMGEGKDFWRVYIHWVVNPDPNSYAFYEFRAWTNRDYNLEGTLSEEEGWVIPFNGADAILFSDWTDDDADGVPDNYDWMGTVSFTVRIARSLPVA